MSLSETYLTNHAQTGLCPHKVEILLSQQHITHMNNEYNYILWLQLNYTYLQD